LNCPNPPHPSLGTPLPRMTVSACCFEAVILLHVYHTYIKKQHIFQYFTSITMFFLTYVQRSLMQIWSLKNSWQFHA